MKTSKQVEQEIEEAKARHEFLKNRRDEIVSELEGIEQELRPYKHNHYSWGKIQCLQSELEKVKLIEESELLPIPILSSGDIDENYRITKITPKRIYLIYLNRRSNTILEEICKRDGSDFQRFNISETLKVWEEYLISKEKNAISEF